MKINDSGNDSHGCTRTAINRRDFVVPLHSGSFYTTVNFRLLRVVFLFLCKRIDFFWYYCCYCGAQPLVHSLLQGCRVKECDNCRANIERRSISFRWRASHQPHTHTHMHAHKHAHATLPSDRRQHCGSCPHPAWC